MSETQAIARALTLLQLGRAEEALDTLGNELDVDDPLAWYVRAAALLALDDHDAAAHAAETGLELDAEHAPLLDTLAAARAGRNDLAGAEQAILEALRLDPEDPDLLTRYAYIVARANQMPKAEKLVERALSLDPENAYALQMHALLATARDDRRAAITRARELLRHVPENPLGHNVLGIAHAQMGQADAAADHLGRAVRSDPTDPLLAEAAREMRSESHWLLWPLRPLRRLGPATAWIAAMVILFGLRALQMHRASTIFGLCWAAFCVYSWIAPSIVRKLTRRF